MNQIRPYDRCICVNVLITITDKISIIHIVLTNNNCKDRIKKSTLLFIIIYIIIIKFATKQKNLLLGISS